MITCSADTDILILFSFADRFK